MPQAKGVEPFSRLWTVTYKVVNQSHAIAEGQLINRPRTVVFVSKEAADAFYAGLIANQGTTAGHPANGTIQAPFVEKFFNRKTFITAFVNEHVAMVQISS